jgi:hypothetical protein
MKSIRERILQTLMAMFQSVASNQGATLIRSPTTPVTRDRSPALLLVAESDQVSARPNDRVERQLVLRLTALARDQEDVAGQTINANGIADGLLVAAHLALFANKTVDGLAIGLQELDCDWQEEDADADLAAMPARYQITYRTLAADISQLG